MRSNKLGIKALSYFYLCLVFFYVLPLFIFSTQLLIFGQIANPFLTKIIHVVSIVFFYFLYMLVRRLKKTGLLMAVALHTIFFVNSIFILSAKTPILEIKGRNAGVSVYEGHFLLASIIINILIIIYLLCQRRYFVDNS